MQNKKRYRKNLLSLLIISNAALLVFSLYYASLTAEAMACGEEAVRCVFKTSLPLYCPGCGGSRALVYLLKLDIVRSFVFYPPLIVSALILLYFDIVAFTSAVLGDPKILSKFKLNILILIPIFILVNFFIRNALLHLGIDYIGDFINH